MTPGPLILGFSDSVHDRAVCLFRGAEPLVAIEEERLTRIKHGIDFGAEDKTDPAVFSRLGLADGDARTHEARLRPLVDYCLSTAGVAEGEVDLWIGNSLHFAFPFADRAVFVNHHLAHAASAFFGSGFEDAAVMVVDGYGDALSERSFESVSLYAASDRMLTPVLRVGGARSGLHLDNSLGIFYRIGTLLSGFGVMDEGKAMGLAAYGTPSFAPLLHRHIRREGDLIRIDNDAIWRAFAETGGERDFARRADIAASFQAMLEEMLLHYAECARRLTGHRRLCIAGGVGLNCVANQRIAASGLFEEVFAFPAAADDGIAFGAAWLGAHVVHRQSRGAAVTSMSWGRHYPESEARAALDGMEAQLQVSVLAEPEIARRVASRLALGDLVMWFMGGSEFGPRALGHRSILADPRLPGVRDHINAAVKDRELFRPLAPIVLDEDRDAWFDTPASPFMLFSRPAKAQTRTSAPAVVHVDGTSRVQTVSHAANPRLHALLEAFKTDAGMALLLNTSFNIRGQPIVETPAEAVAAFLESPVRLLVLDQLLVEKRDGDVREAS